MVSDTTSITTTTTISYLPDECWECVFKFIINDNNKNNNSHNLTALSIISKQFLSITDRLRFSLTVVNSTRRFLHRLFERFISLNSLKLRLNRCDPDKLLHEISRFPSLKLTSLNIYNSGGTFPANGLRAFSQKITTLNSLTCSRMFLDDNILLLIAECFPLLKQLNLSHPATENHNEFMNGIRGLLSKCRCIEHLGLNNTYFLNDQHVAELSLVFADLVSINLSECRMLTELALFSLVRNCPSLSEIKMECTSIGYNRVYNSNSLVEFGVYPQLKSLYLNGNPYLRKENIRMFVSPFPNLQLLDLNFSYNVTKGTLRTWRMPPLQVF